MNEIDEVIGEIIQEIQSGQFIHFDTTYLPKFSKIFKGIMQEKTENTLTAATQLISLFVSQLEFTLYSRLISNFLKDSIILLGDLNQLYAYFDADEEMNVAEEICIECFLNTFPEPISLEIKKRKDVAIVQFRNLDLLNVIIEGSLLLSFARYFFYCFVLVELLLIL